MKQGAKELQKLKGVGEILSRRFMEAGYDTFARIAEAGEEGLRKIPGVNPRMLRSIVAQAGELAAEGKKSRAQRVEALKLKTVSLKERVQGIALSEKFDVPVMVRTTMRTSHSKGTRCPQRPPRRLGLL